MLAAARRMLTSDSIITHHHPPPIVGGCFDPAYGPAHRTRRQRHVEAFARPPGRSEISSQPRFRSVDCCQLPPELRSKKDPFHDVLS